MSNAFSSQALSLAQYATPFIIPTLTEGIINDKLLDTTTHSHHPIVACLRIAAQLSLASVRALPLPCAAQERWAQLLFGFTAAPSTDSGTNIYLILS